MNVAARLRRQLFDRRNWFLIGMLAAMTSACADRVLSPSGASSPVGHWSATSVAGQSLPTAAATQLDGTTAYITRWTMDFSSDATFRMSVVAEVRQNAKVIETDTIASVGTWSQNGAVITMSFNDGFNAGNSTQATISGNRITFTSSYGATVFER